MRQKIVNLRDLLEFEDIGEQDLLYWVDYVYRFNVGHKIPNYDNMSWFRYHDIDLLLVTCVVILLLKVILSCLCCRPKSKVK